MGSTRWPSQRSEKTSSYQPVKSQSDDEEDSIDIADAYPPQRTIKQWIVRGDKPLSLITFYTIAAIFLLIVFITFFGLHVYNASQPTPTHNCPLRREWRTLSPPEQQHYISSVRCLLSQPSRLHPSKADNSSLYEDFPWIHAHVGYKSHNSAQFLPWHRYFLHVYETALRQDCGYRGEGLVYWDWTLDSDALEHAPVFDAETGFGGNGDVDGEITVGNHGHCLKDGPFTDIWAKFYDVKYKPHCLSRGFRTDAGADGHMDGSLVSPVAIEEVLSIPTYEDFVTRMESQIHDAIPFGIGGDFETFTAPYDPIFFLHHTQLDRLWWLWQQRNPADRTMLYEGHKERHSTEKAGLGDAIEMKGLDVDVTVRQVMNTQGKTIWKVNNEELLCYRY